MIVDSHCHLDYEPLHSNLNQVLDRAKKAGVGLFLTICTKDASFQKILKIIDKTHNVYGTYGIHPHEAKDYIDLSVEIIKKKSLSNKKIIGIGETGLDFYYNHSDKTVQTESFLKHIKACQETSKTLIVHTRNAEKETYDILKQEFKNKEFRILMHCFTGTKNFAHKLLDLGCYFSASGIITFKKTVDLRETFLSIPNNKILIETDSPYLSPDPFRGKVNEPCNIVYTLKFMSQIKNVTERKVEEFTTENFLKLFKLGHNNGNI